MCIYVYRVVFNRFHEKFQKNVVILTTELSISLRPSCTIRLGMWAQHLMWKNSLLHTKSFLRFSCVLKIATNESLLEELSKVMLN